MPKLISGYIRREIQSKFGPHTLDAVLIKPTSGVRTPGSPSAGTNPSEPRYECNGFVKSFGENQVDGTLVKATDRVVKLLGGALPDGIEPEAGDKIEIEDPPETGIIRTYRIVGGKDGKGVFQRDPVAATYSCHVRGQ